MLQHGIDHLHDEALLGFGQAGDAHKLLLQLRRRPALGGRGRGADQLFNRHAQCTRNRRQGRDLDVAAADLISGILTKSCFIGDGS